MLDDKANAAADFDGLRCRGGSHHGDEEIMSVPIFLWQFSTPRPRTLSAGGYVCMFREPDRLKPARFALPRQVVWAHCVVSSEHRNAKFHKPPPGDQNKPG